MSSDIWESLTTRCLPFITLLIVVGSLTSCGGDVPEEFSFDRLPETDREPIRVGQIPSHTVLEMLQEREQFLKKLGNHLDHEIEYRFASDYSSMLDQMENHGHDMVFLAPLAYVEARDDRGLEYEPLVMPQRSGEAFYNAIIVTRPETGIRTPEDLRGRSMAFVDRNSASGYLFPTSMLVEKHGFDPENDFSSRGFLGSHDDVLRAVRDGRFEAGAVYDDARTNLYPEDPGAHLPIVARTKDIPSEPLVVSQQFQKENPEQVEAIKEYLLSLHETESGRKILQNLGTGIERFVEADDDDYDSVRLTRENVPGLASE